MFLFYVKGRFYCNQLASELRFSSAGIGCTHMSISNAKGLWHCWPPKHYACTWLCRPGHQEQEMVWEVTSKFYTISRNFSLCTLPIILFHKMRAIKRLTGQWWMTQAKQLRILFGWDDTWRTKLSFPEYAHILNHFKCVDQTDQII